jgi:hypothetical protein
MPDSASRIPWQFAPPWGQTTSLDHVGILCQPDQGASDGNYGRRMEVVRQLAVSA